MLTDHRLIVTMRTAQQRESRRLTISYANFLAGLATWSWFITMTFRDAALITRSESSMEQADQFFLRRS